MNTALDALFISEEEIGIWQYAAHPETDSTRRIVDLIQPWVHCLKGRRACCQPGRAACTGHRQQQPAPLPLAERAMATRQLATDRGQQTRATVGTDQGRHTAVVDNRRQRRPATHRIERRNLPCR
ncbi:hypothetical protein UMZ34_20615 [Halopseudomonas pachastrellae]|nr:hypothetical protein UMZ34_20615 [Halopseudomonas pachastrellae]